MSSDGSRVAIGAPYNDGNASNSGHVRVYEYASGAWTQLGSDIDGEAAIDFSGMSVSMNSDGSRVAIGAHLNDGNASNSGHVRVYGSLGSDQNKPPAAFEWVSSALDTINITKTNLTDTYVLKWSESVDTDTIKYLISIGVGQLPADLVFETADTSLMIYYQNILDYWSPNLAMLSKATLKISVSATDGFDTVKVSGDDRVVFVNRYDYLSTNCLLYTTPSPRDRG